MDIQGRLTASYLVWDRPPYTYLTELEPKLCCTRCQNRTDNKLSVRRMPRNE